MIFETLLQLSGPVSGHVLMYSTPQMLRNPSRVVETSQMLFPPCCTAYILRPPQAIWQTRNLKFPENESK